MHPDEPAPSGTPSTPGTPEPAGAPDAGVRPDRPDLGWRVRALASLAEPVRRRLYDYVVAQPGPVSRDEAAAGAAVPRHTAKFHLDRLVAEGLLETSARRLTGRSGPGAGRPSKLYRRGAREVAVSLPERRYDLAGRLMAEAIERSTADGRAVRDALDDAAAAHGRALGRAARAGSAPAGEASASHAGARADTDTRGRADARPTADPGSAPPSALAATCDLLADLGYEPRREGDDVVLASCPFHALVADHTALVCGMNLALLGAAAVELGPDAPTARLEPAPGRCCVVLRAVTDRP